MQKYNCKTCGAELYWDAEAGSLKCEYCDSVFKVSDFDDATLTADENKDTSLDSQYTNAQIDENSDMVVYECSNCGAEVVTSKTTMATTCAFCGRAISLSNKAAGSFRPDKVIPFKVTKEKAMEIYKKYTKSSPLIPKYFKDDMIVQKIQGLYVPFHIHSANVTCDTSIKGEKVTSKRSGYDRIDTHKVYDIDVSLRGVFENVPADASKKMEDSLMDALEPYNYETLDNFNPAYMAGYFAEQSDEDYSTTRDRTTAKIEKALKNKSLEEAGNYSGKTITSYNDKYTNDVQEYAMLPVWLLNVEYDKKMYTFAINGQTGKSVGKLPMSKLRLFGYSAGIMFASQIIMLIINLL